jgi:hypothetical protein
MLWQQYLQYQSCGIGLCSTANEWMKKMWDIYTMEYDSPIMTNGIKLLQGKWMELGIIMLSEIS